jgi:hypothetical protein
MPRWAVAAKIADRYAIHGPAQRQRSEIKPEIQEGAARAHG